MSNVFYSLAIGMLLLINPVHANNDSSTEENVPHLLEMALVDNTLFPNVQTKE